MSKRWTMISGMNGSFTSIVVRPTSEYPTVWIKSFTLRYGVSSLLIDWGDGNKTHHLSGSTNIRHNYSVTGGNYIIKINRDLVGIDMNHDNQSPMIGFSSDFDIELLSRAFYNRRFLQNLSLPKVKRFVGDYRDQEVFMDCVALSNVSIPKLEIGAKRMFYGCSGLENISLPQLRSLSSDMFNRCISLATVNFPLVEMVDVNAMCYTSISSINDNNFSSLKYVCGFAFNYCSNLESINNSHIEVIGYGSSYSNAFANNSNLESVNIPSCETVRDLAFYNCSSLSEFSASNLKLIDYMGLTNCDLVDVSIPSVEKIGAGAFSGNIHLQTLSLPSIVYLGYEVFGEIKQFVLNSNPSLNEDGSRSAYTYVTVAQQCSALTDIYMTQYTVEQIGHIKKEEGSDVECFPWGAPSTCRFHGSDGYVLGSGEVVYNNN